jgi:phage gp36-like protein
MISYIEPLEMELYYSIEELIQASNRRNHSSGSIDNGRLEQACLHASGIVYGWLIRRFTVEQLTNLDDSIRQTLRAHAAILARYYLDGSTDEETKKVDRTEAWLKEFTNPSSAGGGAGDNKPDISDPDSAGRQSIAFRLQPRQGIDYAESLGFHG